MYSVKKLNELVRLGSESSSFEFEGKYFKVKEEFYFYYDDGVYQASLNSIKDMSKKEASVFFVIDNSRGNEKSLLVITQSYKKALKKYDDFENIIKTDWSTDELLKRKQGWFSDLKKLEIYSSDYICLNVAYDFHKKEFIFVTLDHTNGKYYYGIFGDLIQEESEMFETDGSESIYKYGFKSKEALIAYIENTESMKYIKKNLLNWKGKSILDFQPLEKAS